MQTKRWNCQMIQKFKYCPWLWTCHADRIATDYKSIAIIRFVVISSGSFNVGVHFFISYWKPPRNASNL